MTPTKPVSGHPEHPGMVPGTEHLDLGDGSWADLRLSLNHGQAQQIEAAQMVADYDTKGEFQMAVTLAQSALSGAPEEWRKVHYETTLRALTFVLEAYEETMETALLAPDKRRQMADARAARDETYGRVFTAAWSMPGDPAEPAAWAAIDSQLARRIYVRAAVLWRSWNKELGARLKDDAGHSPETE